MTNAYNFKNKHLNEKKIKLKQFKILKQQKLWV